MNDLSGATWRKSTRSNGAGGNCVEVSDYLHEQTLVRDSKLGVASPVLHFSAADWRAFIDGLQTSQGGFRA
ncbi:DUF397 domain-containing protein [Fodinicola acaciae]|uniref:DUF397 domain-containing protein n=1 Tax=Fodinicola acaciae TaxID=2681555 RepID=UPI0013D50AE7|nr:DUF397 domain-containing protein [Fodinicola acaciae]